MLTAGAQGLQPTLVSGAGAEFRHPVFGTLYWSLGEPVIETYQNGDILTQGFHQAYYTLVSVFPLLPADFSFRLYPNPFSGSFTVEVNPLPENMSLEIYSLPGQCIWRERLTSPVESFSPDQVPSGAYIAVLRQSSNIYRAIMLIRQH